MASASTQRAFPPSSSSSSSTGRRKYEVFLNFYGKDTRKNFTDHLYAALQRNGIIVYRDDKNLQQGEDISQELLSAIQESQYAVVIISENYAFSRWCLRELTQIIKCKKEGCLTVLPVFYHVDPSDIRKQKKSFAKALNKHRDNLEGGMQCTCFPKAFTKNVDEPKFGADLVKSWRVALEEIGNLSGWHVHDRLESIVIEEITTKISCGLNSNLSYNYEDVVGIEPQVEEVIRLLHIGQSDVRIVGVYGMGGIGKTTLANFIYDRVSCHFEANCFLASIREESSTQGLVYLQKLLVTRMLKEKDVNISSVWDGVKVIKKRLRNIKGFIVLDDVDEWEQLESLVGSPDWFGQGSKIIITSRDSHLLTKHADTTYEVTELNDIEALSLLSWKAFKQPYPKRGFVQLSKDVVNYAKGLPLALEVLGSFLFNRQRDEWKSVLGQLKINPHAKILDKLKISFDGLEDLQKQLFLDIACFFNGRYEDKISSLLESCGYYPKINLQVLRKKSLLKISKIGQLQMHDLLVQMGQQIVCNESSKEVGKRSRLWRYEDIIHVLKNDTGTDAVESIVLRSRLQEQLSFDAFSKMKKLRILMITNQTSVFDKFYDIPCDRNHTPWYGNPSKFILSNELRVMKWDKYPLESLPLNFQPDHLIELEMPYSCIKQLWNGWKSFYRLKCIKLCGSKNLIETPDFNGVPNLEILDFSLCENLSKIHPSIQILKGLREFSLEGCRRLDKISLESLPYWLSSFSSLEKLDLSSCELRDGTMPSDLTLLSSLKSLSIGSNRFTRISDSLWLLSKLEHLDLNGSTQLQALPKLPLSSESFLQSLHLSGCNLHNGAILDDISCLSALTCLFLGGNEFTKIPDGIWQLSNLRRLNLENCICLQDAQNLPLSSLRFLEELNLGNCNLQNGAIPSDLSCLSSLACLALGGNKFTNVPDSICQLSNLLELHLNDLTNLQALSKLPMRLAHLDITNCPLLARHFMMMDFWNPSIMSWTADCSIMVAYIGYDDKPYKIVYLHPEGCFRKNDYQFLEVVACGRMLESGVRECFDHGDTISSKTVDSRIDLDLEESSMDLKQKGILNLEESHQDLDVKDIPVMQKSREDLDLEKTCRDLDVKGVPMMAENCKGPDLGLKDVPSIAKRHVDKRPWLTLLRPMKAKRRCRCFRFQNTEGSPLDLDWEEWKGYALFVDYEINEYQIYGTNPFCHLFVCEFRADGIGLGKPLVLCVPRPPAGRNGFWVYIPEQWFKKQTKLASTRTSSQNMTYIPAQAFRKQAKWENFDRLQASVATNSQNVKVKDCRSWVVRGDDMSEFCEVLSTISGLDSTDLKEFLHDLKILGVDSPFSLLDS